MGLLMGVWQKVLEGCGCTDRVDFDMINVSNNQEELAMADQENRKPPAPVPFNAFEAIVSIHERHVKRLLLALMISTALLAVSNGMWLYAWMQYDYVGTDTESVTETEVTQDGRGINIYGDGNEVQNHGAASTNPDNDPDSNQNPD